MAALFEVLCVSEYRNKLLNLNMELHLRRAALRSAPWRQMRSLISSLQHTHKVCYKERHNEVDYGSTMLAIATEDLQAAT